MTYEEALRIGTKAQGTIKCTYATLYDSLDAETGGGKNSKGKGTLFSLQKAKPHKFYRKLYDDNGMWTGYDETTALEYISVNSYGNVDYALEDIAVVQVEGEPATTKLVPCMLLYDTYNYIRNALTASGMVNHVTWEKTPVMDETYFGPGGRIDTTKLPLVYKKKVESAYDARTQRLLDILQDCYINKKPIYVKPAAFDWHPIELREDATSSDTTDTETTETITEKKKKKDNALKLLLLALATNLIGE